MRIQSTMPNASPRTRYEKKPPKGGWFIDLAGGYKGEEETNEGQSCLFVRSYGRKMVVVAVVVIVAGLRGLTTPSTMAVSGVARVPFVRVVAH